VLGENPHTKLYPEDSSIWRTKLFSIFGYEDFSRTKVFDDIVGDLKIDALYIFDKALLTTSFCSVER
jgi:hypothetical protein